jgi:hypothetical protein
MGQLNGQQKGILEERLKTLDRDMARKGLAPGYRRAEFQAAAAAAAAATAASCAACSPGGDAVAAGRALGSLPARGAAGDAVAGGLFQQPSMALVGLTTAGPGAGTGSSSTQWGQPTVAAAAGVATPAAAAALSAGHMAAPPAAAAPAAGGPEQSYLPLQSFETEAEVYAEFEKCLAVLANGELLHGGWGGCAVRAPGRMHNRAIRLRTPHSNTLTHSRTRAANPTTQAPWMT